MSSQMLNKDNKLISSSSFDSVNVLDIDLLYNEEDQEETLINIPKKVTHKESNMVDTEIELKKKKAFI